jgi:branched-chain amino acid transport system permease protein
MNERVRRILVTGVVGGIAAWHLSLVGMVETFSGRLLIGERVTLAYTLLAGIALLTGFIAALRVGGGWRGVGAGAVAGLVVGLLSALLAVVIDAFDMRRVLIAATPRLAEILTFNKGVSVAGVAATIGAATIAGAAGGALDRLSRSWRRMLVAATAVTLLAGLLRDVLRPVLPGSVSDAIYTSLSLSVGGAVAVFAVTAALVGGRELLRYEASGSRARATTTRLLNWEERGIRLAAVGLLVSFPIWAEIFLSNTADFVALYILMALGLNLVVGYAGLLDLGYVAFWAIGAYSMAVLTSPELRDNPLDFWVALPLAVLITVGFGVLLGLPVLRMRGDYLAIATLGFGEIVRLLVLSDWLKPYLGGAQGVTRIAHPRIGPWEIDSPQDFYYLLLVSCAVALFLSVRLKQSRIGRAWMAIREDEDVAQATGINRVAYKLLAFALGASMGGLSGAIFASLVGSVVPASFQLLVSINVLAIIIIGGMGSLPGVLVGAVVLVGLPELLREFQEYRLLVYGALLVIMMLLRPAGLLPEETRVRELEDIEERVPELAQVAAGSD